MYKNNTIDYKTRPRFRLINKIYIWSVVLEPLLFLIAVWGVFGQGEFTIRQNISRVLQLIVLIALGLRILAKQNGFTIPNPFYTQYKIYFLYLFLALAAGLFGYIFGAYSLPEEYVYPHYTSFLRPFIEYIIALYYFFYFVILFKYFVKTPEQINFFFKIFTLTFVLTLLVGYLNILAIILFPPFAGMPRHLMDMYPDWLNVYPGKRFYGLTGEPRDTYVYLILCFGIFSLKDIWINKIQFNYLFIALMILTIFLTQSYSAFFGLFCSATLLLIYFLPKSRFNKGFLILSILAFIVVGLFILTKSSRSLIYFDSMKTFYTYLKFGWAISPSHELYANNVLPLWHRYTEILQLNVLPTIFGTGLGSSSIVNNIYLKSLYFEYYVDNLVHTKNPSSSLVRIIYETGLIGLLIFIAAFTYPIKYYFINRKSLFKIYFWMLMILGAYFAHRSVAPFYFLGITLVILENKFSYQLKNKLA